MTFFGNMSKNAEMDKVSNIQGGVVTGILNRKVADTDYAFQVKTGEKIYDGSVVTGEAVVGKRGLLKVAKTGDFLLGIVPRLQYNAFDTDEETYTTIDKLGEVGSTRPPVVFLETQGVISYKMKAGETIDELDLVKIVVNATTFKPEAVKALAGDKTGGSTLHWVVKKSLDGKSVHVTTTPAQVYKIT